MARRFVFGLLLLLTTGCSGMLYYPTQQLYSNPIKLGYKLENLSLPLGQDDAKIHAWLLKAPETKTPKAVVFFFHGNAENLSSHVLSSLFLLKAGYEVLIFDYPGYGLSTGDPSPESTVKAGRLYLDWLKLNRPNVPWIVLGQSLGGAVALRVLGDTPKDIPVKLVVIDSSFLSYQKVGRKALAGTWITWPFQWMAWLVLSDKWAPESVLSEISPRPLLVIHGTEDKGVPFELGEELFEKAGEPKTFWKIEGGQHIDALQRENGKYQKALLELIDRKLGNAS